MNTSDDDLTNVDVTDPRAARREKLKKIALSGRDPWGRRFDDRLHVADARNMVSQIKYQFPDGSQIEIPDFKEQADFDYRGWKEEQNRLRGQRGEEVGPHVRVAGRIMLMRPTGKLVFLNLREWTGEIQVFIGQKQVGEEDFELAKAFDLGDLIGVDGRLGWTNTGELTVFADALHFHCKMLDVPPDKHAGLHDPDMRQRMRYTDLAFNEGVREVFLKRTRIVRSVRSTLDRQGFIEVEGPTLHAIAGGAAARPFITHHNTLDMQLYLRIALELHLKRLMVGGIERVYELGRVYRNEGISPRHNPEFTMLETYQAYADYRTMMDLTEQIFADAIDVIGGGMVRPFGDREIDYTPPFARARYDDLLREHARFEPTDLSAMEQVASRLGLETEGRHPDVIKNEIFEETVENKLIGPVFVIDYPASICPLTKRKADAPEIAERFELFINGMEVANAYTELNDPDLQEELFRTQLAGMAAEDSMAHMDHDFVRALRNAMPPAGGLGIGIDRLVMLLTNQRSIRDVILFPLLRPESG